MQDSKELFDKVVAFHGHVCPGLLFGYKAALYAAELLELGFSSNEQVVCISENDACGVDAISVMLGCSIGKGNLLFHMRGKQAYAFYNRKTGASVRLVLRDTPEEISKSQMIKYYTDADPKDIFDVKEPIIPLPEKAKIFDSYKCECCGEKTGANWVRLVGGKKLCLDCAGYYDRFNV